MTQLWIKICGLSTAETLAAALECSVDAIGFVFAASPRRIAPVHAARLARSIRGRAQCIAVMRHPTQLQVDEMLAELSPDMLQTDLGDFAHLTLPAQLGRLGVLRAGDQSESLPARVLFEGPASGTGIATDWDEAAAVATQCELILAGGLNPGNVRAAIDRVRPFGVDVSSGVETSPGVKSRDRIAAFVAAARGTQVISEELAK